MKSESTRVVEHLFRSEYGKLVAILTGIFGSAHIRLAEDIVQETLIAALEHWPLKGVPDNPGGWLMQVARRKAINELKRNTMMKAHHRVLSLQKSAAGEAEAVFLEGEIRDHQLRMIFTCCHPSLSKESQIALTLKTLGGFGVGEVARALLTTESVIEKRLYRAKKSIRDSQLPYHIPAGKALDHRLETVLLTLYLMFNEGYNATRQSRTIRKELCLEAMRLAHLLIAHFGDHPALCALQSLMCFHTARFDARLDDQGAIVLFEDQDRSLWNRELIHKGLQYLDRAGHGSALSAYHVEASIAAEHCMADSFETTHWSSIYRLYQVLQKLKPNPVITLNLAIIQSQVEGLDASLEALHQLEHHKALRDYHLLPATQGVFEMKRYRYKEALQYFQKALALQPSPSESSLLRQKMDACAQKLQGR